MCVLGILVFDSKRYTALVPRARYLLERAQKWSKKGHIGSQRWLIKGDVLHLLGMALTELEEFNDALEMFRQLGDHSDEW